MKYADDEAGREFDGNHHNDADNDEAETYCATLPTARSSFTEKRCQPQPSPSAP